MSKPKIELHRLLSALDAKDRNFYDNLSEEEQQAFSPFLALRYASTVENPAVPELANYVLEATNRKANPHFFDLKNHPKLQWLLLTTISPGFGAMKHKWMPPLGAKKSYGKIGNFLRKEFPNINDQELEILVTLSSEKDIKDYAASLGYQDREIDKLG
jgi:hypothetical protein